MSGLRQSIIAGATGRPFRPASAFIDEAVELRGQKLGHVDFRGLAFASRVDFRDTIWTGLAWFDGATFHAGADFSGARFDNDARFDRATFDEEVSFVGCEFRGVADFDGATFEKDARFDRVVCCANVSLDETRFRGKTSFRGAELDGGLWCRGTVFTSLDIADALINGRVFSMDAAGRLLTDPARMFSQLTPRTS